jgi:hypothetical protein
MRRLVVLGQGVCRGRRPQVVYSKFSNSGFNEHQLILRHVLSLDYSLQVQQRLQSGLSTSIKWIPRKLRPLRNDQLLDVILQPFYAYPLRRGTVAGLDPEAWLGLVLGVGGHRYVCWCGLWCRSVLLLLLLLLHVWVL